MHHLPMPQALQRLRVLAGNAVMDVTCGTKLRILNAVVLHSPDGTELRLQGTL